MLKTAAQFALITILMFLFLVAFVAEDGYDIYAQWFQGGVTYQGETRVRHQFRFLIWIILPSSVVLGAAGTVLIYLYRNSANRRKKKLGPSSTTGTDNQ